MPEPFVNDTVLNSWRSYLDHEETNQKDKERLFALHERCLLTCVCFPFLFHSIFQRAHRVVQRNDLTIKTQIIAPNQFNYVEFWNRFALLLSEGGRVEEARKVWERATESILKRQPEAFLHHALFEEFQNNHEKASLLYDQLLSSCLILSFSFLNSLFLSSNVCLVDRQKIDH